MEENNNSFIIKVLAIVLVAILGLNVYRTETTKKDLFRLTKTVERLAAQLDSLEAIEIPSGVASAAPAVTKKQFSDLSKAVSSLETKINSLRETADHQTKNKAQLGGTTRTTTSSETTSSYGPVSISAKVKVEDRYVQGTTVLPKVKNGPVGVVIVGVVMNHGGTVTSARIQSGSTISDEDVLDACKEAALKTDFSVNIEVSEKHPATITYTFTAK